MAVCPSATVFAAAAADSSGVEQPPNQPLPYSTTRSWERVRGDVGDLRRLCEEDSGMSELIRRRTVLGVLATAAGGLLAACAAPTPPPAAPTSQAPAGSKKLSGELRLHVRTGSEEDTL